ncbi:MAG TPA: AMP-binding protein, partial [Thermosynechococcaceae cyanobacterium]
ILEETQPKVLLTQSHLLPRLPAIADHIVCLDQEWALLHQFPTHNPDIEVRLEQTSHLVYTSGTTGKPKGVITSHGNLVNYILAAQERFGFDCRDVMPAIARFTFSITMFELLSPLVAGGRLDILEREHILDFQRMVQTLQQSTVIHTSPSLLQKLLTYIQDNNLDLQSFQQLKHVSTGGDMVPTALLETMRRVFQKAEVYVIYGCSEVSCMGCSYPVVSDRPIKSRVVKPFTNVSIRLYDAHLNLVPIGIPGEIYIGGAGVTQGYLQREALTQEKFVTIDGCRFYRTGDIGRFDTDGNLEMLGRADFQIKLRGIRIELGEIEATLRQAPGVREGVVMARELGTREQGAHQLGQSEKSLVAYVVLDQTQKPPIENIRSLMQEKLPDYMVPAAFVVLDAMPVNINQKVDRRALPMPTPENIAGYKAFVAPRDEWEAQLTAIWEAALGIQPIGIQNNFFELGGDSLKAVQILTQIETQFGKRLPITAPLEAPTIEALAKLLRSDEAEDGGGDLVVLRRGGTKPPLFCLYGVLLYRELVDHLDADQPVYGVYLQEEVELLKTGAIDSQKADFLSVPGIASRYLQAIRTLQPHGPYYLAGESFGGVIAFEMAKQLQARGEAVALVAMFDSLAPQTKTQKPLAQKLKLHGQLLSQQGISYAVKIMQPYMQALGNKLQQLQRIVPPAKQAWQPVDTTAQDDIRSEMRQQASASYVPSPYSGELVLFRAIERDPFEACDRDMGWTSLAAGGLQIFDVPGDHLGILKDPNVRVMAEQLQAKLRAS